LVYGVFGKCLSIHLGHVHLGISQPHQYEIQQKLCRWFWLTLHQGAIPLIGFPRITFRQPIHDVLLRFISNVPNEGLIRFPTLFNQYSLLLTDPSSLQEVLTQKTYDFEKPKDLRDFLRLILGNGLIVVESDEHKFQRKHLTPAFHFRHIKELYPVFWSKSVDLVGRITAEIHANPEPTSENKSKHLEGIVEINHWANKVTMDIIGVGGKWPA